MLQTLRYGTVPYCTGTVLYLTVPCDSVWYGTVPYRGVVFLYCFELHLDVQVPYRTCGLRITSLNKSYQTYASKLFTSITCNLYHTVRYGTVQCTVVPYGTKTVRYGTVQYCSKSRLFYTYMPTTQKLSKKLKKLA